MGMDATHPSLLLRIRDRNDASAWREFAAIYAPVVRAYARRYGVPTHELDDLVQEVLWAVSNLIRSFDYDPAKGRFRSWLHSVTHRRILKWRAGLRRAPLQPEDSQVLKNVTASDAELEKHWDRQWRQHAVASAMERVRQHVDPRTFEAFRRYAILQQPAGAVAEALSMTVSNVYLCKSRFLERLREEVEALDG